MAPRERNPSGSPVSVWETMIRPLRRLPPWIALSLVLGCDASAETGSVAETGRTVPIPQIAGDAARGLALVREFECNRCHEGTGLASAELTKQCVGCHQAIRAGTYDAPAESLARWRGRITSLLDVPSLSATGARLRRDWVVRFLLDPYDLRPHMTATMPRLRLTESQARDIAAHLVPNPPRSAVEPPASDLQEGRRRFEQRGCPTCHAFSGAGPLATSSLAAEIDIDPEAMARGVMLAPDLRFTRERMLPDAIVPWLLAPTVIQADTAMPRIPLTPDEAASIARFIVHVPLAPSVVPDPPARLPLLDRPVAFVEVSERTFRRLCWHCHSDPDYALGDGGPGNTGGLGFPGRGVDLAAYQGVSSGYLDEEGHRRSLFREGPGGVPRLVGALLARQSEEAGRPVPGIRGMPLGLPSIPPEEIQLVETWIAQGRPE